LQPYDQYDVGYPNPNGRPVRKKHAGLLLTAQLSLTE